MRLAQRLMEEAYATRSPVNLGTSIDGNGCCQCAPFSVSIGVKGPPEMPRSRRVRSEFEVERLKKKESN
jgi:hypothetical protein